MSGEMNLAYDCLFFFRQCNVAAYQRYRCLLAYHWKHVGKRDQVARGPIHDRMSQKQNRVRADMAMCKHGKGNIGGERAMTITRRYKRSIRWNVRFSRIATPGTRNQ